MQSMLRNLVGVCALIMLFTGCVTYDPGPPVSEAMTMAENFIVSRPEVTDITGRVLELDPIDSFSDSGQPYLFMNSLSFRKVGWTYHVEGTKGVADVTVTYESVDRSLWRLIDWGIFSEGPASDSERTSQ